MTPTVSETYDKVQKDFQEFMTATRLQSLADLKLDIARFDAAKLAHELTLKAKA